MFVAFDAINNANDKRNNKNDDESDEPDWADKNNLRESERLIKEGDFLSDFEDAELRRIRPSKDAGAGSARKDGRKIITNHLALSRHRVGIDDLTVTEEVGDCHGLLDAEIDVTSVFDGLGNGNGVIKHEAREEMADEFARFNDFTTVDVTIYNSGELTLDFDGAFFFDTAIA